MFSRRLFSSLRFLSATLLATTLGACSGGTVTLTPAPLTQPQIKHVFTIILENQAYDNTFGPQMPVPYLTQTVASQGATLLNYYGTSHFSLGNYISLVSGQAVTTANQDDCTNFGGGLGSNYVDVAAMGTGSYDQVQGKGCVYPAGTLTVADQLTSAGYTWKGYMEDMGNDTTREAATCGQPINGEGQPDNTSTAQVPPNYNKGGTQQVTDQYAARHNPFVYFHSLIDSGACASHVVPLNGNTLPNDLASIATTPNYSFITPNLCDDGHDVPCKSPNSPSTYVNENGGESNLSTETNFAASANNVLNVASPAASAGAVYYRVYASNTSGGGSGAETLQATVPIGTAWVEPQSGLVAGAAMPFQIASLVNGPCTITVTQGAGTISISPTQ